MCVSFSSNRRTILRVFASCMIEKGKYACWVMEDRENRRVGGSGEAKRHLADDGVLSIERQELLIFCGLTHLALSAG